MINEYELHKFIKNKFVIVHDNASFHHRIEKIIDKYFGDNIIILPNIAYSPELNPIEQFFGILKLKLRYCEVQNKEMLLQKIIETAYSIDIKMIIKFVENSKSKWIDVLNMENI